MEESGFPPRAPTSTGTRRKLTFLVGSASGSTTQLVPSGLKSRADQLKREEARRIRRAFANRKSASRARLRRAQHKDMLENDVSMLEAKIASLNPKLAEYGKRLLVLSLENRCP